MKIWDTAGQESFRSISKIFYRACHAVILCYSIDNLESFDHLQEWVFEAQSQCDPDTKIFLIGCKSDLEEER